MSKRFFALFLAAVMLFSTLPLSAFSEPAVSESVPTETTQETSQPTEQPTPGPYADWDTQKLLEKYQELLAAGDETALSEFLQALTEAQLAALMALKEAAGKTQEPTTGETSQPTEQAAPSPYADWDAQKLLEKYQQLLEAADDTALGEFMDALTQDQIAAMQELLGETGEEPETQAEAVPKEQTPTVTFVPVSPDNEHDVQVNGTGPVITIYCLQQSFKWPNGEDNVGYYEHGSAPEGFEYTDLLTEEEINIIRRVIYAGYPNDCKGFLRKYKKALAEKYGVDPEEADIWITNNDLALQTNIAIWTLMREWGKPGSEPDQTLDYSNPDNDPAVQLTIDLITFARGSERIDPPKSSTIIVQGSGQFRLNNGRWSTGDLVITQPAGYKLLFTLNLPAGVTAKDAAGNTITTVEENQPFRLIADDPGAIEGNLLTATAVAKYPTDVTFYVTDKYTINNVTGKRYDYQTMLYIEEASTDLTGTLKLTAADAGGFSVTKLVTGTGADLTKEFDFTVTLSDTTLNGYYGEMNFENGVAHFTLTNGETLTARDLPVGVKYFVAETDYSTTAADGSKVGYVTTSTGADGTIAKDVIAKVTFNNEYKRQPVKVAFSGSKTLTGKTLAAGEFSFTLKNENAGYTETVQNAADGAIAFSELIFDTPGTYTYTVEEETTTEKGITIDSKIYHITVTVTDDGNGILKAEITGDTTTGTDLNFANTYKAGSTSVTLGGHKTFTGFPAGSTVVPVFTFTLTENGTVINTKTVEKQGDYQFDSITYTEEGTHTYKVAETAGNQKGVTYDTRTYTVTVTVTDNAGQLEAVISGGSTTGADLDFTNSYKAAPVEVTFSGTKTLTGKALAAEEFSFTLTNGTTFSSTVKNDADGHFTFPALTFDTAGTYIYTVSENATDEKGITIDTRIYHITVTVTDDGNGELKAAISGDTTTGTNLYFANNYKPNSTSVVLGGTKTFTGFPEDSTVVPVFTFTLSKDNTVIDTATVEKQGDYRFNSIPYTEEGTYTYTVAETAGDQAGVTYDTKTYTVTVTVTDNNGQLEAVISGGSTTGADLNFTNSYKAAPVEVTFSGTKTLNGKALAAEEFSFTLTNGGDYTETVKNSADGKIQFSALTFDAAGVYTYTVKEETTAEKGITIDSNIYHITVTVTDDGNGELKAAISGDTTTGADLNFANTYKAGSTSVTLGGHKTFTGFPAGSTVVPVFAFTLSENGTVIDTKTVEKQGDYQFNSITYTEEGTHTYIVAETAGNQAGVTYATNTYTVTVTVTDNEGQLEAAISGDTTTGTDLNFTNSYKAAPVEVTFSGRKTLTGRTLTNEEFSFTLVGDGVSQTVKNDADGKITFVKLTYTVPGVYTYTVKEEATADSTVAIDTRVYDITVTVTDSGNGQLAAVISGDTTIGSDLNFTNVFKTGSLSISKTVTGDLADKTKLFTFTVTLDAPGTFSYTGSKTGTITSGGTVLLKHGESITISGIPEGTSYTVTESDNSGYRVYKTGEVGKIAYAATAAASFTNSRSSVPQTGDNRNLQLWLWLMALSFVGAAVTVFFVVKKRRHFKR